MILPGLQQSNLINLASCCAVWSFGWWLQLQPGDLLLLIIHPFGWMYNTTCTGRCSSPRHAHQEMLAGLHLLPDQISVVSCSAFVSVVFHIAKAASNEAGVHPGLYGHGCPKVDTQSCGWQEPTATILLLQLTCCLSGITRWCSCT